MSLKALQEAIHYHFKDEEKLRQSLTHRSIMDEQNNQRLEFLGDRVLGLVVAKMLFEAFPEEREGALAPRHAALVCGEALVQIAQEIDLGAYLILSASEEAADGRQNASHLEDACEALIGAIYLDGGLMASEAFIHRFWQPLLVSAKEPPKDPKTALQEWGQARGLPLPDYVELKRQGPAHAPEFTIEVRIREYRASGMGASKRGAEQAAAEALLEEIAKDKA